LLTLQCCPDSRTVYTFSAASTVFGRTAWHLISKKWQTFSPRKTPQRSEGWQSCRKETRVTLAQARRRSL
jgi:hypothetical protein